MSGYVESGYWIIGYAEGDAPPILLEGNLFQEWAVAQTQPIYPVWLDGAIFQAHEIPDAPLTLEKALHGSLALGSDLVAFLSVPKTLDGALVMRQTIHELVIDLVHRGVTATAGSRTVLAAAGLRVIIAAPPRSAREDRAVSEDRTVISRR